MATERLTDFLRRHQRDNTSKSMDLGKTKAEWLAAINDLLDQISTWLKPAADEGLLKLARGEIVVREEALGVYQAPVLQIQSGVRVVSVEPIARVVFGGTGRIDMGHGPKSRVLIRTRQNKWMLSTPDPKDKGRELTEETLSEALQFLLS